MAIHPDLRYVRLTKDLRHMSFGSIEEAIRETELLLERLYVALGDRRGHHVMGPGADRITEEVRP